MTDDMVDALRYTLHGPPQDAFTVNRTRALLGLGPIEWPPAPPRVVSVTITRD